MSEFHEETGRAPSGVAPQPGPAGKHVENSPDQVASSTIVRQFHVSRIARTILSRIHAAQEATPSDCLAGDMGNAVGAIEQIFAREIAALRFDLDKLRDETRSGA